MPLTPEQVEEKWKTQDFHIYRPKSHEAVEAEWMYGDDSTAEEQLIEQEEKVELTKSIEDKLRLLSPRQREAIEALYYGGLTQVEVAKKMGISQPSVSQLQKRALERLTKESLENNSL